ncbi:uncharacterized protein FTJAE_10777 [Fusarium tjaetaba]|uniref:Uncharacterized protein n=1 Tax=Fusarium tjaetaba TaxID=1567544 RepID=A0A8H5QXT5_9HYPO|nr:uncharacterized protein FTJAE_10777 [Fusarium tjaetaba]KAF5622798.1 hypothetical protein FTJAE_10777 [Fusarium tjaetaba]
MAKRRLSSDSEDDAPRKFRKVSFQQQIEDSGNLNGTISSLLRCSLTQPLKEVEPEAQLLTPERDVRSSNDEPTNLDEHSNSVGAGTDNSAEEPSDDFDIEESLKSPRPQTLREMSDYINELKKRLKSKTRVMKYWRESTMLLLEEVEVLEAELEEVNKKPTRA